MRNIVAKLSPAQEKIVVQREECPLGTETIHTSSAAGEPVTNGDAWKPAVAGEDRRTNVRFMTESQPDSAITRFGHATLTLLFYALVLLYLISIFISYFTATPTEVNSIQPSDSALQDSSMMVTLVPRCYGSLGENASCGTIYVAVNYTGLNFPALSPCAPFGAGGRIWPAVISGTQLTFPLCYYPEPVFSPVIRGGPLQTTGVIVSFSNIQPSLSAYGTLEIRKDDVGYSKLITLAPGMVKSLHLGVAKTVQDDTVVEVRPSTRQYQMDGIRLDSVSDVRLQLGPFTNVKRIVGRSRSILGFFASLGNAVETVKHGFILLIPLWGYLFARKGG